jgi:DNA-binding MarR family transcriptional regulator
MRQAERVLERLFQLTTVMSDAMTTDLATRGLTQARATVIAQLHRAGPSNQRALAEALRVTPRNITGLVDALEGAGLVQRSPHPKDRRATLVSLTDAGSRGATALAEDQSALAGFLFDKNRAGDLAHLAESLDRVLRRLDEPAFATLRQAALDRWPGPANGGAKSS